MAEGKMPWEESYPEGIDWRAPIPEGTVPAILDDAVRAFAGRPATDFLGHRLTFADLGRLVDRAAAGLTRLGVGPGVHVGLFLPNTPAYLILYFAVLRCGAVVVNFNPLHAEREVTAEIAESETDIMVTLDLAALLPKVEGMLGKTRLRQIIVCRMAESLPFPKSLLFTLLKGSARARWSRDASHVPLADLLAGEEAPPAPAIAPGDLAVLQFTGGTTGVPKCAMLTHANIHANVVQSALWFPGAVAGGERMLGVLPFFHVFAMTVVMLLSIRLGAEIVMLPRFDLTAVLKTIHRRRPTLFPAVPTIYGAINTHKELRRYDLSSLKMCFSGGAPLPLDVQKTFEALTGCSLVEGYGLTETSPVVTGNPLFGVKKPGSIGLPLPGTIVEIVDLVDRTRPVGPGERGEICIRGPQVMKGYFKQPEETALVLVDGRLHTGDIGTMDEDGYTFVVDRAKDLILCGGYNVYPRVVEEAIQLHPAVAEVVVAGIPDPYRGETVKAWIKLVEGARLTHEELTQFLLDKLSPIERPKTVEFRDELPKTMIGKLSRKALLEEEKVVTRP
jgi:long-chain acyl-CoA synthetase